MARGTKKQHILEKGAQLIHLNGFNNTSINDIVSAAEVPKGSFYNYFKSKEDYGLELLDFYESFFNEKVKTSLMNKTLPPLKRLKIFLTDFEDFYARADCSLGCPIGNFAEEMSDLNEAIRGKVVTKLENMKNKIKTVLDDAVIENEIEVTSKTEDLANFIVNSWEGAVLRMKADKCVEPLKLLNQILFSKILIQKDNL